MKKIFSFFAAVLFAGSMMAVESVYKQTVFNTTNNSKGISSYESTWSNTTDGFTVNIVNANNNNNQWAYIKMGSKQKALVGSIATATAIDHPITKVVLTIDALTASNINSIKLYRSADGTAWTEEASFEKATGAQAAAIAAGNQAANLYYKIEVDCKKSSNGIIAISKVEFYEAVTGPYISATPNTWNFGAWEQADGDFVENTIHIQGENLTGEIALNFMGALFSVVPNRITPDASGNIDTDVTIKSALGWTGNESYDLHVSSLATTPDFEEKTILTASINVVAPVTNCATARTAALAVSGNDVPFGDGSNYTVRGYVTEIATAWSSTNEKISFWIADAKDGGRVIKAYNATCKTEAEAPQEGDLVDVTGRLTKYNTTPEFAQGCTFTIVPTATAIDNAEAEVKAIKRFENGVLIIEKNGVKYNAQGAVVR